MSPSCQGSPPRSAVRLRSLTTSDRMASQARMTAPSPTTARVAGSLCVRPSPPPTPQKVDAPRDERVSRDASGGASVDAARENVSARSIC